MNKFYKGYDHITASDTFKQRMVRTLQNETREEAPRAALRLPIKRRTLAILIAAAVLVLAIGTAAAATIINHKYRNPSAYLDHSQAEREQNQNTIPDVENAIASAKPETCDYSIVMLPEMDNAEELNGFRTQHGQPVYSEEDWGWIREIRPEIEEVLIDGDTLTFNIRMHTDHGMNFSWEESQCVESLCEEAYYTVEGDDTIHKLPYAGGGTIPASVSADGATSHVEIDLYDLTEPFPTKGIVHLTVTFHIRDVHVDDMNDVGLLSLMTYSFTFDASAGADVAAPIVTERALSGATVLFLHDDSGREYTKRVSLDGVVLEETLYYRSTGIYATYKVKSAPEDWTQDAVNALLAPSSDSGGWPGFTVTCAPKGSTDENEIIIPGKPNSIPTGEYTCILPFFPSDYERIKTEGYEICIGYRCITSYNGEPVGENWVQPVLGGECRITTTLQPMASFDLRLP